MVDDAARSSTRADSCARRVADIHISDPKNPFYTADRAALSDVIHRTPGLAGVDRFVITNGQGTYTLEAPGFN